MRQSTYNVTCPGCGKTYNLPAQTLRTQPGVKKRKLRCSVCKTVWPVGLGTTSTYGAYFHSSEREAVARRDAATKQQEAVSRTPGNSWSIRPSEAVAQRQAAQALRDKEYCTSLRSYWALFDPRADKAPTATVTDTQDLAPSWSLRQKIARAAARTGIASPIRLPVGEKSRKKTPFCTEVRDSWIAPSPTSSATQEIPQQGGRKTAFWISSGILVASLSLIVPLVAFGPLDSSIKNRPTEASAEPAKNGASQATDKFLAVLAREPELRATVLQSNKGHAKGSWPILIVSGNVLNSGADPQSGVIVRGEIIGSEGNVIAQAVAPCGVLHRHTEIKETPREQIGELYRKNGKLFDCSIRRGQAKKYQLIFDNIPGSIADDITVKVRASSTEERSCASGCSFSSNAPGPREKSTDKS